MRPLPKEVAELSFAYRLPCVPPQAEEHDPASRTTGGSHNLKDYPAEFSQRRVETQTSKAVFHATNTSSVALISGGRAKDTVN